jgi:hypothetical protein
LKKAFANMKKAILSFAAAALASAVLFALPSSGFSQGAHRSSGISTKAATHAYAKAKSGKKASAHHKKSKAKASKGKSAKRSR